MNVLPGYTGLMSVGGRKIRCTSFGLNTTQDAQFFNHVIGLNDTIPSGNTTKGESVGTVNTQRRIWRPSVIRLGGSLSFPATENSASAFFDEAVSGTYIPTLTYQYYCKDGGTGGSNGQISFTECRVNGYDVNIQAGDILNITVDIAAKNATQEGSAGLSYITAEKMVTWDKVTISSDPSFTQIRGFSMKINNNIQNIYTCGTGSGENAGLLPADLRIGMQEVTGSISCYLDQGQRFIPTQTSTVNSINFIAAGGLSIKMNVVFYTSQVEGMVGPIVCEIPFTGVGRTFN